MLKRILPLISLVLFTQSVFLSAAEQPVALPDLPDLPIDSLNLSGLAEFNDHMALVTDEGSDLVLLKRNKTMWQIQEKLNLDPDATELDLEALDYLAPYLYALGSHSAKRKKLKSDKPRKQNLKRLAQISPEKERRKLFRIKLTRDGKTTAVQSLSLQKLIAEQEILAPFIGIPSKENGIDLEALSSDHKGRILVGFRGPVLRGNWVPVLRLKLESGKEFQIKKHKWLWLNLNGRGLRGMTPLKHADQSVKGQLILAGPVGDQALSYDVYYWDGKNQLEGSDSPAKGLHKLCSLSGYQGKPEGIQFKSLSHNRVEFLLLEDGINGGNLQLKSCPFPVL